MEIVQDCAVGKVVRITERMNETSDGPGRLVSVILLNDDITPMDYVVDILQSIFNLDCSSSRSTMMAAHHTGSALVGLYPEKKAVRHITMLDNRNRETGNQLRCLIMDLD